MYKHLAVAAAAVVLAACGSSSPGHSNDTAPATLRPTTRLAGEEDSIMRIRLTVEGATVTARLYDNTTAREFASLLPVSITVHDLGGREKAGTLPRELGGGHGQNDYRAGQIGYWPPSHDLAIYYHVDGFRIPSPGIVMIGEIDSGLEIITDAEDNETLTITAD